MVMEKRYVAIRHILRPSVSVHDELRLWLTLVERHGSRIHDKLCFEPPAHRPAHHGPREQIDDHCQVQPALSGPDGGDITHVRGIGLLDIEVTISHIRRHRLAVARVGGGLELAPRFDSKVLLAHQPPNPPPAHALPLIG